MELNDREFMAVLGISIAGPWLFYQGLREVFKRRFIEDIPTSKARSIAMGQIEIKGKAEALFPETLKSPLSHKECVYYYYFISKHQKYQDRYIWAPFVSHRTDLPFYIYDKTGKVLIDPSLVALDLGKPNYEYELNDGNQPIPPNITEILTTYNIPTNQPLRCEEWYICPEDNIYILGAAMPVETFVNNLKFRLAEDITAFKNNIIKINDDINNMVIKAPSSTAKIYRRALSELDKPETSLKSNIIVSYNEEAKQIFKVTNMDESSISRSILWSGLGKLFLGFLLSITGWFIIILMLNEYLKHHK